MKKRKPARPRNRDFDSELPTRQEKTLSPVERYRQHRGEYGRIGRVYYVKPKRDGQE